MWTRVRETGGVMTPNPDLIRQKLFRLPASILLLGVRSLGIKLWIQDSQVAYDDKSEILARELLNLLKARKGDLLDAIKSELYGPHKPPILGQSWEEFWHDQGVEDDGEPETWRDKPITEKQRETLLKGN